MSGSCRLAQRNANLHYNSRSKTGCTPLAAATRRGYSTNLPGNVGEQLNLRAALGLDEIANAIGTVRQGHRGIHLLLDLFGRVPHKGEKTEVGNVMVSVEQVERTRVVEVLVTLRETGQAGAAA